MIIFRDISNEKPYKKFVELYKKAEKMNEPCIDVICLSTFDPQKNQVNSRFLNLKYILKDEWTFFSNYNSTKAKEIQQHDNVSLSIYWNTLDSQLRLKGKISKCSEIISDEHFLKRDSKKNALSVSSEQSSKVDSYETVLKNYNEALENYNFEERPKHWGGYSFIPYYFEFWEGHVSRINKRVVYEFKNDTWIEYFLQP